MGSKSDWDTMSNASKTLTDFGVPHETRIVSAHRTPQPIRFEISSLDWDATVIGGAELVFSELVV